jgi:hypothetical protein
MADSPDGSNDRITVLVVGETQQGKSTMIRQFSRYAGIPDLDIDIGVGNRSCTSDVGLYSFSTFLQSYRLEDQNRKPIQGKSYDDLCRLTNRDAVLVREGVEEGTVPTSFTFMDTPGLDDSDGNDMDIMAGIISRVSELRYINAIIYVRSVEKPFSASFRRFFQYIQQSMPAISQGILVIHTCFTTQKAAQYIRDDTSYSKLRRDAFKATTNLDTLHFFMDNDPDPDEPFAVLQSLNEVYRLLLFLQAQKPLPTGEMKLLKTKSMCYMDGFILSALSSLKIKLEKRYDSEIASSKQAKQDMFKKLRDISAKRTLLTAYQNELKDLKSSTSILMGNVGVDEDFGFLDDVLWKRRLRLDAVPLSFNGDYTIDEVRKTLGTGCKWQNEQQQGTIWQGTLSSGRFKNLVGSATFYTTGALKYREKISHLETESARLEGQLEILSHEFDGGDPVIPDDTAKLVQLDNDIKGCAKLIGDVEKQTFDMQFYPRLKHVYALDAKPSQDDVFHFIKAYDASLADLYWKEVQASIYN